MDGENREILKTAEGCDLNTKMTEETSIPQEFLDTLVNEFAYDPVRLPLAEDPAQVLYNRRTLEKIWETKHSALNPYTRQPFDIRNSIPQIELRQQMRQYIESNQRLCQSFGFTVIPDYTRVLSETQMKDLLKELILNFRYLERIAYSEKRSMHLDLSRYLNDLWRGFNLLRLYCQYREENRDLFLSIKGYDYLFRVINGSLYYILSNFSTPYDDSKEVCTEVVKIMDVIGLEDHHLQAAPQNFVRAFIRILYDVARDEYSKIQSRVLRCYCCNIDYFLQNLSANSCDFIIDITVELLAKRPYSDIVNEDLYYGMAILKAAWIKNYLRVLEFKHYVNAIVSGVIICISRFREMHAMDVETQGSSSSNNIYLLTTALGHALFLIDCLTTADNEDEVQDLIRAKERLRSLDIVKDILQMVELVFAGFKSLESSHLQLALKITTTLYINGGFSVARRNDIVKSLGAFLRSDKVDPFDYNVKRLLDDIVRLVEADSTPAN